MKVTLGISPCPNDTFLFDAMIHQQVDTEGLEFELVMEDVEVLNTMALAGKLDVTKLSFGVLPFVCEQYALLETGSALGNGVGPLLVTAKPELFPTSEILKEQLQNKTIAIPGTYTTANLLLSLFAPVVRNKTAILFSDIPEAVIHGKVDAGILIHEGRFTYKEKGLHLLLDLGQWWETETGTAIPLGGIVMKRNLGQSVYESLQRIMKRSLEEAWKNYPDISPFVQRNAQEMNVHVMRSHIELYVNDYTYTLGNVGRQAIDTLQLHATRAGLIKPGSLGFFYKAN